jgi:predicted dehydrogenase
VIRVCLVGCGRIARVHAGHLAGHAVLSCCSRSRERAETLRAEFGGERVYDRYEEVLAAPGIDAVVICTPPEHHAAQAVAALAAGKSVLLEKPACLDRAELQALVQAAARHPDRLLMVAENYYYKPSLRMLRELVADGIVGAVRRVEVRKEYGQPAIGWRSAHGALLEGGVHFVALLSGVMEAAGEWAPTDVAAEFPGAEPGAPERRSVTRLRYAGGIVAELRYAWDRPAILRGTFQHSRIEGSEGSIAFESNGLYAWVRRGRAGGPRLPGLRDLMGYREMTRDFLACLAGERQTPFSDLRRAVRDLEIVLSAYGA